MRQHHATFANFICRFGVEKVLLDYAEEIVLPALSDETLVRRYGEHTSYFIKDYKLLELGEADAPVLVASGRFIKNTVLKRDQIFDPKLGLVKDRQTLASAPSAFFVLILNNHRLVYFPETPFAPDIGTFEATMKSFIGKKYREHFENVYATRKESDPKITKASLRKEIAPPTINVIPLTNEASVEDFLRRFSKLKKIEFQLITPNQEIDGHAIWGQLREYNGELEPDRTTVRTERDEGFDLDKAKAHISDAAASGNQRVRLAGLDQNNNRLDGDNESFRISTHITDVPDTHAGLVKRLYNAFVNLLAAGTVVVDQPAEDVTPKLERIRIYL